jgi:transcriptional regulator of acetoin/glycerol metabolism
MAEHSASQHTDAVRAVLANPAAPVHSVVAASWRRSLIVHGLDPDNDRPPNTLTATQLREAQQEIEPLTRAAQGPLDRLFQAVGDSGCCVLLTNRDGVPVDRRGALADDETFHRWGLWMGAVWSEAYEGTNGIGACLAERRAITIHRDQHFHTRNIGLSCTAAPIYDHEGRLAAALDVSSCRDDLTQGFVNLIAATVGDAARTIEAQNFRQAFPQARILLAPGSDRGHAALLAIDRDDLVVGATRSARIALGITDARIAAQLPAADLLSAPEHAGEDEMLEAQRGAVRRALARAHGNVSAAARALGVSRATLHRKLHRLGMTDTH